MSSLLWSTLFSFWFEMWILNKSVLGQLQSLLSTLLQNCSACEARLAKSRAPSQEHFVVPWRVAIFLSFPYNSPVGTWFTEESRWNCWGPACNIESSCQDGQVSRLLKRHVQVQAASYWHRLHNRRRVSSRSPQTNLRLLSRNEQNSAACFITFILTSCRTLLTHSQ